MTPVEVCCLAVETVWLTDGPSGLTARAVTGEARTIGDRENVDVGSMHKQLYWLKDPSGDVAFGSMDGLVQRAHDDAVAALTALVAGVGETVPLVDGLVDYWAAIVERPAWLRMMSTTVGPAGVDPRLAGLRIQLGRLVDHKMVVVDALHGAAQGELLRGSVADGERSRLVSWLVEGVDNLGVPSAA